MVPGELIAGRFQIEAAVTAGGMGTIHRARDRRTGALVALKGLRDDTDDAVARFGREARLLAELDHPHVVRHVEHGVTEDGRRYLAMEWLDGEDLQARLLRGPLTIDETRALGQGLAEGLAHAHARGVIHRDVKPSNLVLVGGDPGRVKLVDFGVARGIDRTVVTRAGGVVGTPGYMAPEQARGEVAIDARCDLFALGAVLFEALTGRPPFVARDLLALLFKILIEDPPPLRTLRPDVPPELAALIATLLAKDRAARPSGAPAVADALAGLRLDAPAPAAPPTSLTRDEQLLVCAILAPGAEPATVGSAPTEVPTDDEDLRARLRRIATQHGANIEWLGGGGWIAMLRGEGRGATDQVALAARCALAIQAEVPDARLAIGTGRAALHSGVPVGPVVDAAVARLREGTGAGEIVVDDVTAHLLEARFAIDAGRLIAQRDTPTPVRTLIGKPSPCVGRERELAHVREVIAGCFAEPAAGVALVIGAAGIGKSRLLHELRGEVPVRFPDVEIWTAIGDPVTGAAPLSLIAPALRAAAARHVDALDARDRADVEELMTELAVAADPGATQATGATRADSAGASTDRIRRGALRLIEAACARGPLLIVLDDLHWGDGATVSLLDAALGRLDDAPLAIVGLARPEVREAFPRLWAERRVHELRMTGLRPKPAAELVRAMLGDSIADARVDELVARGDGNPFYLEELIRNVAERGDHALPETVIAMASARLEALEPAARQLLRAASIHGDGFLASGVAALLDGVAADHVSRGLRGLVEREVLALDRDDPDRLRFRHAYLRDAAYAMLTPADRALGHRLAGEWCAIHAPEPAVIARHFDRAGDPRAAAHYLTAARQALRRSDADGAVVLARRGEEVVTDERTRDDLRRFRAGAESWRGDFRAVDALAHEMMASSGPGSKPWWSAAVGAINGALWLARPRALHAAEQLLVGTAPAPDAFAAYGRALGAALPVLFQTSRRDIIDVLAPRFAMGAAPLAAKDPFVAGMIAWLDAARAMFLDDDPWRAIASDRKAVTLFEQAGDVQRSIHIQGELAMYLADIGDLDGHTAENRRVFGITSHMGLGPVLGLAYNAFNCAAAGQIEQARAWLPWPLARSAERGFAIGHGIARAAAAMVALHDGRVADAEADATAAVLLSRTVPRYAMVAYAALAWARLAAGKPRAARRVSRAGLAVIARHPTCTPTEALVRLAHVEALLACGDPDASAAIAQAQAAIRARAAKAPEDERAQYLTGVPWVARTLAL